MDIYAFLENTIPTHFFKQRQYSLCATRLKSFFDFNMRKARKSKVKWPEIKAEIHEIATIGLVAKSTYLIEKLIWIILGLVGLAWLSYVIYLVVLDDNPTVTNIENLDLTDSDEPAITICSESMNRMGIAERIGNSIESSKVKKLVGKWSEIMKLCATMYSPIAPTLEKAHPSEQKFKSICFSDGKFPQSCKVSTKDFNN